MSADAGQEVLRADDIHVLNVDAQLQENGFRVEDSRFGFIPDVHQTPNEKLKALQI